MHWMCRHARTVSQVHDLLARDHRDGAFLLYRAHSEDVPYRLSYRWGLRVWLGQCRACRRCVFSVNPLQCVLYWCVLPFRGLKCLCTLPKPLSPATIAVTPHPYSAVAMTSAQPAIHLVGSRGAWWGCPSLPLPLKGLFTPFGMSWPEGLLWK